MNGCGIFFFVVAALLWIGSGALLQKGEIAGGIVMMVYAFFVSLVPVYCFSSKNEDEKETPESDQEKIKIHVLPGGHLPERKTDGAIGYDVYLRAIVSATEMDSENPNLRKTLFDFKNKPEDAAIAKHVQEINGKLVYRMDPGESVLVGIGFVTEMPFPMFYWVAPRSGLASKHGITVTNAPGTVDPDYRGEAGVLVYNRNSFHFDLEYNIRIAQVIFQTAIIPDIEVVDFTGLGETNRGAGGFGSTGLGDPIK